MGITVAASTTISQGITISAPRVVTGTRDLGPGWVRFAGGVVMAVGPGQPPSHADVVLPSGVLAPGLVDAQVNGGFGVDLAGADDAGWTHLATRLPSTGVTSWVPTVITAPVPELVAGLRTFARVRPALESTPGAARVLGVHLEGPFLSERRRGAHRLELLTDPTQDAVDTLVEAGAGGALLYVTLAPERPGAMAAVKRFVAAGIRVAVGHSDANDDAVHAAADAGASLVTHLYNAQRPLHHRDAGFVGGALVEDRLTCGLIADSHHVAPAAIRIAFSCKRGRIMLVTDAVAALGMPPGRYVLAGEPAILPEGRPPHRPDGTVAGAAAPLDDCIGNAVAAGVPLPDAIAAATRIPADAMGRPELGRLAPGCAADAVWLDADPDRPIEHPLRARTTWIAGVPAPLNSRPPTSTS